MLFILSAKYYHDIIITPFLYTILDITLNKTCIINAVSLIILVLLSCFCRGLVTTRPWAENKPAAWSSWTILPHWLSALFSARSASYLQHVMLDSTIRGPSRDPAKKKNYFNIMVRYYVVIQIYLWLKILILYLELFPFASD